MYILYANILEQIWTIRPSCCCQAGVVVWKRFHWEFLFFLCVVVTETIDFYYRMCVCVYVIICACWKRIIAVRVPLFTSARQFESQWVLYTYIVYSWQYIAFMYPEYSHHRISPFAIYSIHIPYLIYIQIGIAATFTMSLVSDAKRGHISKHYSDMDSNRQPEQHRPTVPWKPQSDMRYCCYHTPAPTPPSKEHQQ